MGLAIFTKEYKYEGLLLLFLSLIAILLGSMVLIGESSVDGRPLSINPDVFLIGDYPKVFADFNYPWSYVINSCGMAILKTFSFRT